MESNPPIFLLTIELLFMVCDYLGVENVFALMLSQKRLGESLRTYFHECNASQSNSSMARRQGINLLARNRHGLTILHCAIFEGRKELIELLVGMRGDQVNTECSDGIWSPLKLATTMDDHETVQLLVTHGAVDEDGYLLLKACQQGRYKILRALLQAPKPNFDFTDKVDLNPLDLAVESGSLATVQTLLTDPRIQTSQCSWMLGTTRQVRDAPILRAITLGKPEIVKELLSAGFRAQNMDLGMALKLGNEKVVSELLATGIELCRAKWGSSTALICATEGGLEKAVRELLPIANTMEQRAALMSAVACSHFHLLPLFKDIKTDDSETSDVHFYHAQKSKEESRLVARHTWKAENECYLMNLSWLKRDMLKIPIHYDEFRARRSPVHHVAAPFATM